MNGTVYIAGPMRGLPEFNFPEFHKAERLWSAWDYGVFNPARRDEEVLGLKSEGMTGDESELPWTREQMEEVIRADLEAIFESDIIYMLRGWEHSIGARAEHALALWLKKEIRYQ